MDLISTIQAPTCPFNIHHLLQYFELREHSSLCLHHQASCPPSEDEGGVLKKISTHIIQIKLELYRVLYNNLGHDIDNSSLDDDCLGVLNLQYFIFSEN